MKTYRGERLPDGSCQVWVIFDPPPPHGGRRRRLRPRLDLVNHSPTGFEWGYAGSGPAQLALALLANVLQDPERAIRLHQPFKRRVITSLDRRRPWQMTEQGILAIAAELELEASRSDGW